MVNLGKYSVKELSETGVEFYLTDIRTGLEIEEPKFVVYGMDSEIVTLARRKYSELVAVKHMKEWKKDEYLLDFITACVKSWDEFQYNEDLVKNQDKVALRKFFVESPQFKDQISEFVTERANFLAVSDSL